MRAANVSRGTASRLSPRRRRADVARLGAEKFDVVVIGGGVTGVGAAVDAASRGLSVAVVEARDLAAGTSSRSSKLIHGGLRYLEQLEFGLVHEALTERGLLATRLAPHLVRPVPFLVPLSAPHGVRGWPLRAARRAYYGAGLAAYDAFATAFGSGRGMPVHQHLTRTAARRLMPSLRADALTGAIRYHDAQMDDARMVVALARTAASLGAAVLTSSRVVAINRTAREVTGVRVRDTETGTVRDVRARTVIAATGVWSDEISGLLSDIGVRPGLRVRASKGVHLVVPRAAISGTAGLILRTATSVLFVIPWGGHWIVGTTDTDWRFDRDRPAATAADIRYLLDQVNPVLDRPLTPADIEGVYAGLRPLLTGDSEATSALSRRHAVVEPMLGLLLVAGGKYTTYRVMAADVVDRAARRLRRQVPASRTDQLPLLGADGYAALWRDRADVARRHQVSAGVVEHLLERYGSAALDLLRLVADAPALGAPLPGAPEYLGAEVAYAAAAEAALHLDDVLTRRTRISIETTHRGLDTAPAAARIMGEVLGWDRARQDWEVDRYRERVDAERRSQQMPDDAAADAVRRAVGDARTTAAQGAPGH